MDFEEYHDYEEEPEPNSYEEAKRLLDSLYSEHHWEQDQDEPCCGIMRFTTMDHTVPDPATKVQAITDTLTKVFEQEEFKKRRGIVMFVQASGTLPLAERRARVYVQHGWHVVKFFFNGNSTRYVAILMRTFGEPDVSRRRAAEVEARLQGRALPVKKTRTPRKRIVRVH